MASGLYDSMSGAGVGKALADNLLRKSTLPPVGGNNSQL